jgi:hypothetical protein
MVLRVASAYSALRGMHVNRFHLCRAFGVGFFYFKIYFHCTDF